VLHILNGGATETTLERTSVPGSRFSFRDALIDGPAPAVNGSEWRRLRVEHLAAAYGVEIEQCKNDFQRQDEVFDSFKRHDEVTLWFESDLFCQLNLLFILDWCARNDQGDTKLSLICIGEFPGRPNFRGLGELDPDELASLFEQRVPITQAVLKRATQAWDAYRSGDPRNLEALLNSDNDELPFLNNALKLHLARFPSVLNGLNRIENKALELIAAGASRFGDLFPRFIEAEPDYGLGDAQFWNSLQRLTQGSSPLLMNGHRQPQQPTNMPANPLPEVFAITEAGAAVMNGEGDNIKLNGIDNWLGGVHLRSPANVWRWDEVSEQVVKE
jgi:hypothetical protein